MGAISTRMFYGTLTASLLAFLFVQGCFQAAKAPEGTLDTPAHHVTSGFRFLEKGYSTDARREFEQALQLDPYYSAAHRGMGLVYGKENEFKSAFDAMGKARDDASSGEQKSLAYVGFMRLNTMRKDAGWLERVEERFKDALRWKNDLPQAYFYMGVAYKQAGRIADAERSLNQVLKLNGSLVAEAKKELTALQKPQ